VQSRMMFWLDRVGNLLILQLVFVGCSIPLVTVIPAAVALQRCLADLRRGDKTGVVPFIHEFRRAWKQAWELSLGGTVLTIGLGVSIPFWYASGSGSGAGWLAVGFLTTLASVACALYLSILEQSEIQRDQDARQWLQPACQRVMAQPARAAGGVVLVVTWLAAANAVPSVLFLTTGLAPAYFAHFSFAPRIRPVTRPAD
jgi:uncharacterized membrane protein YesL